MRAIIMRVLLSAYLLKEQRLLIIQVLPLLAGDIFLAWALRQELNAGVAKLLTTGLGMVLTAI